MAGRPGVSLAKPEGTNKATMRFVKPEFQVHPVLIVFPAGKAPVLLHRMGFAAVPCSM
jgi:putative hemolysin